MAQDPSHETAGPQQSIVPSLARSEPLQDFRHTEYWARHIGPRAPTIATAKPWRRPTPIDYRGVQRLDRGMGIARRQPVKRDHRVAKLIAMNAQHTANAIVARRIHRARVVRLFHLG